VINVDGLVNDEIAAYLPDRLPCYLLDKRIRYVASFGEAAESLLPLPAWSSFSSPLVVHGDDGTPVRMHEVDFTRLEALAACQD